MKEKRLGLKMTQAQVAEKVGITRAHYTKIERGSKNPSLPVWFRLKKLLKLEDEEFQNEPEEKKIS